MTEAALPGAAFLRRNTHLVTLRDGTRVRIRPVVPDDKAALVAGMERLSPASRYRRFMTPLATLPPELLRRLTEIDYVDHFAYIAFDLDAAGEPGIAVARYIRLPGEPEVAEAAIAVVDDHHRKGLGTLLLDLLEVKAAENGVRRFRAYVLHENEPMRAGLSGSGARLVLDSPGLYRADVELRSEGAARAHAAYDILRAAGRGGFRRVRDRLALAGRPEEAEGPEDGGPRR